MSAAPDLPRLSRPLTHPLVERVVELGRACGVGFYVIPRRTPVTDEWLGASPCPFKSTVPLYCRMADTHAGQAGSIFLCELDEEEWSSH